MTHFLLCILGSPTTWRAYLQANSYKSVYPPERRVPQLKQRAPHRVNLQGERGHQRLQPLVRVQDLFDGVPVVQVHVQVFADCRQEFKFGLRCASHCVVTNLKGRKIRPGLSTQVSVL